MGSSSLPTRSFVGTAFRADTSSPCLVHSLYAVGVGRVGRSSWDLQVGLSGLSKIAEEPGGECYSLETSNLVSFKPYLERFQRTLDNQYYLSSATGKLPYDVLVTNAIGLQATHDQRRVASDTQPPGYYTVPRSDPSWPSAHRVYRLPRVGRHTARG
jgi:hypothetical protein